jgi:aminoglycoside phosphotransferase (APT) family kinase protein
MSWGGQHLRHPSPRAAWALFSAQACAFFRAALSVDDATWARGRGWALSIGVIALPYYQDTNPVFAATARRMIAEVLADWDLGITALKKDLSWYSIQ